MNHKLFTQAIKDGSIEIVKQYLMPATRSQYIDAVIGNIEMNILPIHFACEKGHVDIVRLLIEKNCNIESENKDKWRPIHLACQNGNVDIVRLLIENNAIVECLTDQGTIL